MTNPEPTTQQLLAYLDEHVSQQKKDRIAEVLATRTRHFTVVLEDIHKEHNASAVIRTCDCYGVQDLHIVENKNRYNVNPYVTRGASKWVSMHRWQGGSEAIAQCYDRLRQQGYRIVATSPHAEAHTPDTLPIDQKLAIVMGSEWEGLSDYALAQADEHLIIPMYGFTESLNLSVSTAIILSKIVPKLHQSDIQWRLNNTAQDELTLAWYRKIIKHVELLEKRFWQK